MDSIVKSDFVMTVGALDTLLKKSVSSSLALSSKEKEAVWESFKVKLSIEENPDSMEDRLVSLHALVNARRHSRLKKIDQLISQEADDE